MSYVNTLYHIVLRMHNSELAIIEEHENELYAYMNGIINNYNGKLYRIGGCPTMCICWYPCQPHWLWPLS